MRDHPRIRGEHAVEVDLALGEIGSSPHTRGALHVGLQVLGHLRIIPAYAGSTSATPTSSQNWMDHPRIRGEHKCGSREKTTSPGSSPHTRGALPQTSDRRDATRIIPAYAGSTFVSAFGDGGDADHPRIRGEHVRTLCERSSMMGSSPHTRGAPAFVTAYGRRERIIPAYAGSTWKASFDPMRRRDHPRIRGEHSIVSGAICTMSGSSPHTRGARSESQFRRENGRIIPAYAGSTFALSNMSRWDQDHPRIRGEHARVANRMSPVLGSSPHTRGARFLSGVGGVRGGIIPAYAGSTCSEGSPVWRMRDHPRIRGEHVTSYPEWTSTTGSSPHTRGAHGQLRLRPCGVGIIPAYAGSTSAVSIAKGEAGGSSPHTRGAPLPHYRGARRIRIIPAYAGSTPSRMPAHCR